MRASLRRASPTPRPSTPSSAEHPLPLLLLVVGLTAGAIGYGGFSLPYAIALAVTVGVAVAVAAVLAVARPARRDALAAMPDEIVVSATALLALGVWAGFRGSWSAEPTSGLPMAALCAGAAVVLLLVAAAPDHERELLVGSLLVLGAGIAVVGGWAALTHTHPQAVADQGIWRASGTLGYPNALAGLLGPLLLVAAGRQVAAASAGGGLLVALLAAGWVLSFSRGGAVAMAVALLVAAALAVGVRPGRPQLGVTAGRGRRSAALAAARALWAPAAGAAIMVAGLVPSLREGSTPAPLPAVAGLIVGVLVAVTPALASSATRGRPRLRVALAVAAGVAVTAVGVGYASRAVAAGAAIADGKVSLNSSYRIPQLQAALDEFSRHPLIGTGPGQADLSWTEPDGTILVARYVHNEYAQVLAESGAVAGALLLAAVLGLALTLARGYRARPGPAAAGAVAAAVAFAVHSGVDFLWHLPVLPLVLVCLCGAYSRRRPASQAADGEVASTPEGIGR